jgi:hypothetical protein
MTRIIPRTSCLGFLFMAGWLVTLGSPASAVTLYAKFYNGTTAYGTATSPTRAFSGAGTLYSTIESQSIGITCPLSGNCASDNIASSLDFSVGSVNIHATGISNTAASSKVWGDFSPNFGGLGVGSLAQGADADQISAAANDSLTLTFSIPVTLKGVATLFDVPHEDFGSNYLHAGNVTTDQATVQFYFTMPNLNGGLPFLVNFADANNINLNYTGTSFTFTAVTGGPDYYVSALAFDPTPLPAALPLFATGLGALGLLGWRRKRKQAMAAA